MEASLIGRYEVEVDKSGGVAIPNDWREFLLDESRIVYVFYDKNARCLCIVPRKTMEMELANMQELASGDTKQKERLMMFRENTERIHIEINDHLKLSQRLRELAGIGDRAVLTGALRIVKVYPC